MIEAGPSQTPVLPRYGAGALSDVLPSAAAALGVPGFANVLGLPAARRICVLLVDGFGWNLLRRHGGQAPFLTAAATGATPITAGFPSTTATSLTSLGTGLPPGRHGVLGYQVAVPGAGRLMNSLRWDPDIDPLLWQPHPTIFERLEAHGAGAFQVSPGAFQGSGLTVAGLRGARYIAAETAGDLIAGVATAMRHDGEALVYAYHSDLDKTGHLRGCGSESWWRQLAVTDRVVEQIADVLPADSLLIVTGDHGMVDVPEHRRVDVHTEVALRAGVALLGGEPRARHVYTLPGAAADTLATWRGVLGERAWVRSRDEAVAEGWFGPDVAPELLARIGDVVAAATSDTSIVESFDEPSTTLLIGHHGSLTADEQLVPLLLIRDGAEQGQRLATGEEIVAGPDGWGQSVVGGAEAVAGGPGLRGRSVVGGPAATAVAGGPGLRGRSVFGGAEAAAGGVSGGSAAGGPAAVAGRDGRSGPDGVSDGA